MAFIEIVKAGSNLPIVKLETASLSRADVIAAIRRFEGDRPEKPTAEFRGYVVREAGGRYLGIFSTLDG